MSAATYAPVQVKQKTFQTRLQALYKAAWSSLHLPPKTVGAVVDNLRAYGCKPRFIWLCSMWLKNDQSCMKVCA
ncbi:hypothetical protein C4K03_0553 [Pseudomonas synxantha]|uniref:Uncharacterized protein n=1 Tax=Pseudomonas synxantha TaxID=47883 RepID=A0A3G7U068_9PSED|nr:hypothetical protein C4K03_0553 [Pseudomonas synxantha]